MRNIVTKFIILFLGIIHVYAQEKKLPIRDIKTVRDGIIVTYYFNNGFSQSNEIVMGTRLWKIPGFELAEGDGKPAIPFHMDTYVMPYGVKSNIKLLDCAYTDSVFMLSPALPPVPDDDSPLAIKAITPYKGFYPTSIVNKEDEYSYRGTNLLDVVIQPVQYNYEKHILRIFSKIQYKIQYETILTPSHTKQFKRDKMLDNIITYGEPTSSLQKKPLATIASEQLDVENYLIITTLPFVHVIQPFAEWKRIQGYDVCIKYPVSGAWSVEQVKDSINRYYQEHPNSFKYLLIVGDETHVPAYTCTYGGYTGLTDLYYGVMNNGYIPEIHRGRIPVSNYDEAQIIINKILQYEQTPIANYSFYQKGLNCAYFQDGNNDGYEDRCFTLTAENVLRNMELQGKMVNRVYCTESSVTPTNWNNNYYAYGDTLPHYLLRPNYTWNGNANDITNYINAGTFYVLHRDHGSPERWGNPFFTREHVASLNNGNKLPIVFSINCLTGQYDYNNGDCFAETFLKKEDGGCAGIFAATQTSYSGTNDALTLGMFDAIWPGLIPTFPTSTYIPSTNPPSPIYQLGEILDQGLMKMKQKYGNTNLVRYTFGIFHCFGDPSMEIYTNQPSTAHSPSITKDGNKVLVHTTDTTSFIIFYDKKENSTIEKYQGDYAEYSFHDDTDSVIVCSYGHNLIPVVKTIYRSNKFIQNETITGTKNYKVDNTIYVGNHVTDEKPQGDVNIINANVKMRAREVELHSGTIIIDSNVEIRTSN